MGKAKAVAVILAIFREPGEAEYIPARCVWASRYSPGRMPNIGIDCFHHGGDVTHTIEDPEAVGMSGRRLERIRPAMQSYIERGVYAGISTLIARRGKIVHAEQVGWRDKEARL